MPEQTLHGNNHTLPSVLIIGTDSNLLVEGSEHRARMLRYASAMRELHIIVLGAHGHTAGRVAIGDHVYAYPTTSPSRAGALLEGLRIGKRIVHAHTIDIVSTQDPFETALIGHLVRRGSKTRLNVMEHGDFFSQPYWRRERLLHCMRYVVGLWLIRKADCFRVVSKRIERGLIARGVQAARIVTAPVWTDITQCVEAEPEHGISMLRPEGGVLILTMARFVPQKNIPLLTASFRRVLAAGVRARLVIVGAGPEKNHLLEFARDLMPDRVTFLDWTDDPAGAMKAADIYALSSDYEGWGRVCIEALAAGTPLVMTDVGCAGEVVRNDENGLVVPVRDEAALTEALVMLARDPALRTRLAQAGVETVRRLPTNEESFSSYRKSLECCIVHAHADRKGDRHTKSAS